jgi:hypothetical protein
MVACVVAGEAMRIFLGRGLVCRLEAGKWVGFWWGIWDDCGHDGDEEADGGFGVVIDSGIDGER